MIFIIFRLVVFLCIAICVRQIIKNYCKSIQKEITIKKIPTCNEYENIVKKSLELLPNDIVNIILYYASDLNININTNWTISIYSCCNKIIRGTILQGNLITWNDVTIAPTAITKNNKLHMQYYGENKMLMRKRKIHNGNNKIKKISSIGGVRIMQNGKKYYLNIIDGYIKTKDKKLHVSFDMKININIASIVYYGNKIYASSVFSDSIYEITENNNSLEIKQCLLKINEKGFKHMYKFQIWNEYIFMLIMNNTSYHIYVYDMNKKILQIAKDLFFDNSNKYDDVGTFDIAENDIYILYTPPCKWTLGKHIKIDNSSPAKILVKKCENFVKSLCPIDNSEN